MKRKDKFRADSRHTLAVNLRFSCWDELTRFKSQKAKTRYFAMADEIYLSIMPLKFAEWWVLKRNTLESFRPYPNKEDLDEFLNEEI